MWQDALRDLGPGHRYAPGAEPGSLERLVAEMAQNGLSGDHLPAVLAAGFVLAVWITGRHLAWWSGSRS